MVSMLRLSPPMIQQYLLVGYGLHQLALLIEVLPRSNLNSRILRVSHEYLFRNGYGSILLNRVSNDIAGIEGRFEFSGVVSTARFKSAIGPICSPLSDRGVAWLFPTSEYILKEARALPFIRYVCRVLLVNCPKPSARSIVFPNGPDFGQPSRGAMKGVKEVEGIGHLQLQSLN